VRIGSVELDAIVDAWGELAELAELYPDVPDSAWEPYRALYPELFAESRWRRLPSTCYLIRTGGVAVLVDTGIGPPGLWSWRPEREGEFGAGLEALGVEAGDVDAARSAASSGATAGTSGSRRIRADAARKMARASPSVFASC
jgi:hypothetical protein